jgi:hypothetical protein
VLYTLFVAVLVPIYWRSTPLVFLWLCNVAVLGTLFALWLENSLLASMQALSMFWIQLLWQFDLLIHLTTGSKTMMTNYMFDPKFTLLGRVLSMQHAWLIYLLLWLLWRLGYDRRALLVQTLCAWVLLLLSYTLTKDIHGPAWNLNGVYGLAEGKPQTWMAPWLWLAVVMVYFPVCLYAPIHFFLFRRVFRLPKVGPSAVD